MIQREGYTLDLVRDENEKMVEYHDIVTKEEIYWRQRCRLVWLNEGDRNTNFIHLSTLKHRVKNCIWNLKKGSLNITEEKDISEEMVSFYSSLMTSNSNIDTTHQAKLLNGIPSLVTKEKNRILCSIPKEEEIFKAVCSLGGDKFWGLDGFSMFFF